ncbi:MAG: toast rack family protein [Bacillota bacterium]|nr:toast rack family protein [Bacillota bacterium]MDP4170091.1 toast rack family protein [Bacillota bacterium]
MKKLFWSGLILFMIGIIGTVATGGTYFWKSNTAAASNSSETKVLLKEAKSVGVDLNLGVGNLNVSGTTGQLMEGNFVYSEKYQKPEVNYSVQDERGKLVVNQKSQTSLGFNNSDYRWDLKLNDQIPIDLNVSSGAAKSKLILTGMNLHSVTISAGVGDSTIDLSGTGKQSYNVKIKAGIGKVQLILPKDVGVKVDVSKGIGKVNGDGFRMDGSSYVNDQYGKAKVTVGVSLDLGIGDVELMSQ